MSGFHQQVPAYRPTIIIGHHTFGRDVLRRLLASTALRGVLAWDEPSGGASPSERRLQDLALLWVGDRPGAEAETAGAGRDDGSSLEMMRDLYRQITAVDISLDPEAALVRAVNQAADRLLSARIRAGRDDPLPLGLDVIVIANPTDAGVVGFLDRIVVPVMEQLADSVNLRTGVQGSGPLNFIEVLDFEQYWSSRESAPEVRKAVQNSIRRAQRLRSLHKPTFARIYLVDGETADGRRDQKDRIDEVSLFLELLLFEGQRINLQSLYQGDPKDPYPTSTFGVRLMERSTGLLSRLAAARFAVGWLEYLAGESSALGHRPSQLLKRLHAFRSEELRARIKVADLEKVMEQKVPEFEKELRSLPPEMSDWPKKVRARCQGFAVKLREHLAAMAGDQVAEVAQELLTDLRENVEAEINAELHHEKEPATTAEVIGVLEAARSELDVGEAPESPVDDSEEKFRKLKSLHSEYQRFLHDHLDANRLKAWWWQLGLVLAIGLVPLAMEMIDGIQPPDRNTSHHLLVLAYDGLLWCNRPLVLSPLLLLAVLGFALLVAQPAIAGRVNRAKEEYAEFNRGRIIDRLREYLDPQGPVLGNVAHSLERVVRDLVQSIQGEARRELDRSILQLTQRQREILWLRKQMQSFLGMYGLSEDGGDSQLQVARTGIRRGMERGEDLEQILSLNPAIKQRFRALQIEQRPFANWNERFCDAFLYPLSFLDKLSRNYPDPLERELAQPGTNQQEKARAADLINFVDTVGSFALAFELKKQEGVPVADYYCLLPTKWRKLPGVMESLRDLGVTEGQMLDSAGAARAYLLRVQAGVAPECLMRSQ